MFMLSIMIYLVYFSVLRSPSLPDYYVFIFFQHRRSVKIAVSSFLFLFFIIHFYFNYRLTPQSPRFPVESVVKLRGSIPEQSGMFTHPSVPKCSLGFYSQQDFRPHLQRPFEDQWRPGADGKPFTWSRMNAEEKQEESNDYKNNSLTSLPVITSLCTGI
ncbi:hypothetical protein CHARACLAT_032170 [Characodon lateralis]|uniref:Uncharacterized protein n=1 Tax=Characodon lateralis TaxID=208331 RepID=A0ABU7F880_9TELE|nr:hypothetical protein [Characodon lateralis]